MGCFEINGNLFGEEGLENVQVFSGAVQKVRMFYQQYFSDDLMNAFDLYVDNATANSGYTPITTVICKKYLIIKLGIKAKATEEQIAYQFAHEFMHYIFYAKYGLNKVHADDKEESICSAASLIVLHEMYKNSFAHYLYYVKNLKHVGYRKGAEIAERIGYDMGELAKLI